MTEDTRKSYSILHLYMVGGRMHDVYTQDNAVENYLGLHPKATEVEVHAELKEELEKMDNCKRENSK